jgi:hypothetical protein
VSSSGGKEAFELAVQPLHCCLLQQQQLLLLLHCRAPANRLKWAITEVLSGKEAFTLMLCSLLITYLLPPPLLLLRCRALADPEVGHHRSARRQRGLHTDAVQPANHLIAAAAAAAAAALQGAR